MYTHDITGKIREAVRTLWRDCGEGRWLVAISGGADSTALLLACLKAGIPLQAVHCNFNLRGEESIRDRDFVINLCNSLGVKLHVEEFDVGLEAWKGESTEMTCRRIRYGLFHTLLKTHGCSRIAIAHNSDDNAETLFLNLLRGSGSKGLMGMRASSPALVRPLLEFCRTDILKFLEQQRQYYITDSTNLESDYRRNFIRNDIFPLIDSRWTGFKTAIRKTQSILGRENKIVEHYIAQALKGHTDLLPWKTIREFPDPETLIWRFIEPYGGTPTLASEISRHAMHPHPGKRWTYRSLALLSTRHGLQIMKTPLQCGLKNFY